MPLFRLTKCYSPTLKIYFLPHENEITITGNIFNISIWRGSTLFCCQKDKRCFSFLPCYMNEIV